MTDRLTSIGDVLRAHHEFEQSRREGGDDHPRYSIAISRECYALGGETGRKLGEKLGWKVFDREIIEAVAADMAISSKLIEGLDDEKHHWLREILRQFLNAPDQTVFAMRLKKVILALGLEGNAVFVGRGAGYILPKEYCFRVHLVADKELRIRRCMDRLQLNRVQATQWIMNTDERRRAFIHDYFFQDVGDPHRVDVIFNTTDLSTDACANAILDLAHDRWPNFVIPTMLPFGA